MHAREEKHLGRGEVVVQWNTQIQLASKVVYIII